MSQDTLDTTNLGFRMVQDTIYDTKVFEGLVKAGILPQGFQVIRATVDLSDATGNVPVLSAHDSQQVQLTTGQQIILVAGVATTGVLGAISVNVGLAATAAGAVAQSLSGGAVVIANLTLGDTFTNAVDTSLVQTSEFLVATLVGTSTAGFLQITLVLV